MLFLGIVLFAGAAILLFYLSTPRLRVERNKLAIHTVRSGTFQEYRLHEAKVSPGATNEIQAVFDRSRAQWLAASRGIYVDTEGRQHQLEIIRTGPSGAHGVEIHLRFVGEPPAVVPGQTLAIRFILGDGAEAVLLDRGAFFQSTGGHWVWVVDEPGRTAVKREIRLGRQNPEFHEVLVGLAPGERVITSSYETFGNAERLILE